MKECTIVEDLLPLYEEQLVQNETAEWLETHLRKCEHCRSLLQEELATIDLPKPKKSAEKMMQHAHLKLTIYQFIFVLLSFVFAMNTSILNESFTFMLSYFLFGAITFYFYRNSILTLLLAFAPTFIWTIYATINAYPSYEAWLNAQSNLGSALIHLMSAGIMMALIHTIFTFIGIVVVYLLVRVFKEEVTDR